MNWLKVTPLLLCLLLAGCWDRRELNEIAIMVGIGIDQAEDGYLVSAQIVVPSEVSARTQAGRSPITLIQAEGETIYEAFRKMTRESSRKLYPGHLQIFVLSEEVAREGFKDTLDLLSRDWEIRSDYYIVVAREQHARQILQVKTPIESIPADKLFESLQASEENWSVTRSVTLQQLIDDISADGKEPVLTGIEMIGDSDVGKTKQNVEEIIPAAILQYDHLAVFREDRLAGWLDREESEAYNYITGSIRSTVEPLSCPGEGNLTVEVSRAGSDIRPDMTGGSPRMNVRIRIKGSIGSVSCDIDLNRQETIRELEQLLEQKIKTSAEKTIQTLKDDYSADIFGFGESIRRAYPDEWKGLKENWADTGFTELPVTVKVNVKIVDTGTITNSLLQ